MKSTPFAILSTVLGLCIPAAGHAVTLSGICPDGSMFIVQRAADIPCRRAKLVEPSEMPPLRPELLPKPYAWMVDQEARDPHNPYNLVDSAAKIRALRAGESIEPETKTTTPRGARGMALVERSVPLAKIVKPEIRFDASELRDIERIVRLSQNVAPAALTLQDATGGDLLELELAYSPAFETALLRDLQAEPAQKRVLLFAAHIHQAGQFHPNFLVVQESMTFRPDPGEPTEVGFLLGSAGEVEAGTDLLGYMVVPVRFDPSREMDVWWNDHSLSAVLQP